ncbi:MAG: hypothetical protein F6K26_27340 [Moorea sp. SIO2I5]|nr:hypothetical protein [Moorena sp. SIO2I5]
MKQARCLFYSQMPMAGNRQDACSTARCPWQETGKMPVLQPDAHAKKLLKSSRIYSTTYSEDIDTSSKAVLVNFCMHGSCLGRSAISIQMLPPTPTG